jgi:hypothetical protein
MEDEITNACAQAMTISVLVVFFLGVFVGAVLF